MSNPYLSKNSVAGGFQFQVLDNTDTTPKKLLLTGISTYPELKEPKVIADDEDFVVGGTLVGRFEGDDSTQYEDTTLELFVYTESVTAGKHEIYEFLMNKKDSLDTALVSHNTGSVTIKDINGADKTISTTENKFYFKGEYLFNHPTTEKSFGYSFLFHPKSATFKEQDGKLVLSFTFEIVSKLTPITALTA
jgi:hypothetical protein